MRTAWLLAVVLAQAPDDASWHDVVPPAGDTDEHPPLRALALRREKPEDVLEKASYRGKSRRYAQIRFGSPSSVRVTVVVDEVARGQFDLYVDSDRNRRIEDRDRVESTDRTWRIPLKVAVVEGENTSYLPRAAIFRMGSTGLTFSYAAVGYVEGSVKIGNETYRARRIDGDGNGLLTDAQDQIWIDTNRDNQWDAATEQFLYAAILTVGRDRLAVKADDWGNRLAMAPLGGTGTLRIAHDRPRDSAPIVGMTTTLIGRDGAVVSLSGNGSETTVPEGEYRVGTVTIALQDPRDGETWNFVFAAEGARGEPSWHRVAKDETTQIDPIGTLSMVAGVPQDEPIRAGDNVTVRPALYTADGLLIVTCYLGNPSTPATESGPSAAVSLRGREDRPLDSTRSGFA